MPLYDYDCAACGRRFEVIHGVHADPPVACALCGSGLIRKAFAAPAVHFKGTGWAKKERRSSVSKAAGSSATDADGDGGSPKPAAASGDAESGTSGNGSAAPKPSTPAPAAAAD